MPIIIEALLNKYGRKVTMLAMATSFTLMVLPAFPYIKPRVPASHIVHQRPIDTQFLKYHPFWVLFVANLVQGLGIFLPTLYLPSRSTLYFEARCFSYLSSLCDGSRTEQCDLGRNLVPIPNEWYVQSSKINCIGLKSLDRRIRSRPDLLRLPLRPL